MLDDSAHDHDATVRQLEPGSASVSIAGDKPVVIVQLGPPSFTPEEVAAAEEKQVKRAGPLVVRIRERAEESWQLVRAELAQRSGGEASARTTVLAHYALMANRALELQALLAEATAGSDGKDPDKAFRSLAGLSVVAADLLNKAYAAATEEGKAKAAKLAPVDQLMSTLGVTATGHETSGAAASGLVPPVGAGDPGGGGESSGLASPSHGGGGSTSRVHASKTAPLSQKKPRKGDST